MNPSDFYTRKKAGEGQVMYLANPDGSISKEHYLIVRNIDSDEYRDARDASTRAAMDIARIDSEEVRAAALKAQTINLYVSLVAGWSFEAAFTADAIRELIIESPNNAARIDEFASNRQRFFSEKSQS